MSSMKRTFYFKLRKGLVDYLSTVLGDRFNPQMVEDLLAIVETAHRGDRP